MLDLLKIIDQRDLLLKYFKDLHATKKVSSLDTNVKNNLNQDWSQNLKDYLVID
jgi:hypothetical protein